MFKQISRTEVTQPEDASIKHIGLTQGLYAVVDADDYEALQRIRWFSIYKPHHGKHYVSGYIGKNKYIRLHNYLMNPPPGMFVDHINHDPLDNRRSNLRIVTHSENCKNRLPRSDKGRIRAIYGGRPTTTILLAQESVDKR